MIPGRSPSEPLMPHPTGRIWTMDEYDEVIAYLRRKDAGRDGPHERAAECIEELIGRVYELEETLASMPLEEDADEEASKRKKMQQGAARHWFNRG